LMNDRQVHDPPTGMANLLSRVREMFPNVRFGYFNPPKERFSG
jgi:hypothetical protein